MRAASRYLALGSAILLLGAALFLVGTSLSLQQSFFVDAAFMVCAGLGPLIHLLAMYALWEGAREEPATNIAFFASIAGLVVGLVSLPFLTLPVAELRQFPFILICGGIILLVPYHPVVWGPAVVALGALFILGTRDLRSSTAVGLIDAGSVALVALAFLGVVAFVVFGFAEVILLFAGATAGGFTLVALGYSAEYAASRTDLREPVA